MRWMIVLLLVLSVQVDCYGQSDADAKVPILPNPVSDTEDQSLNQRNEVRSQLFSLFDDDDESNKRSDSSDQPAKPEDAPIQLTMIIVQAGTDERSEEDPQLLERKIQELAQELRVQHLKEIAEAKDNDEREDKDSNNPNELNPRRKLANQIYERTRQVKELIDRRNGLTLLSVPVLVAYAGAVAETQIGQTTSIQYLERIDLETFKLKATAPRLLGMNISMMPSLPFESKGARGVINRNVTLSPVILSVAAMDGREKIEGIDLPVGQPVFTLRTIETSLKLTEGEPGIIELPAGKGKHVFMVVFAQLPPKERMLPRLRSGK